MTTSIGTTRAKDLMITNLVTVIETDKISDIAKIFEVGDINSAPVLNETGECIGIITSHDVVEYEAVRIEVCNELQRGFIFDNARYGDGSNPRIPGRCFDEVGFHMSRVLQSVRPDDPLSRVARIMCRNHVHHVLVLNNEKKLEGMISSLDLLGYVLNEPVSKKNACDGEN